MLAQGISAQVRGWIARVWLEVETQPAARRSNGLRELVVVRARRLGMAGSAVPEVRERFAGPGP
eukprot:5150641-Lingulodinium_polyedra.AAC.1